MSGPSASGGSEKSPDRPGGRALDRGAVAKVASLARLALEDAELERMTRELSGIVGFVSALAELDTSAVEPLAHPLESTNVFRDDVVGASTPRDLALASAPKHDGECFLVPSVLGDE
jgi:aspartyl-tRNA(Asn)/glutamyl-tRNA(Gln) amidotransferase subunit C